MAWLAINYGLVWSTAAPKAVNARRTAKQPCTDRGEVPWTPLVQFPPRVHDGPLLPRGERLPSDTPPPLGGEGGTGLHRKQMETFFSIQTTMSWLRLHIVWRSRKLLTINVP